MPELRLRGGEVDGLDLHYLVDGRGPVVVLVHGLGGFAESWRHTLRGLAGRTTVYALDLPGFGASAKPRARYRLPYFAGALHGFMEALGIREASLVGHSLGAAVAVTYALTHPARTTAEARAAYLATLRHVRTDFEGHAEDYRRAIATLDLPVLLIHGRQDRVVPPAHCTLVADGFARATVRWVEECGHFPQIEQA